VPGKVTKLVPFGAFVRVEEGIEGLVHISELAERHVEIPEQVVQVNDDTMVKIIDIDLERRRISLSLKQANESALSSGEDFDPTLYGMASSYDAEGNYQYPEGFDPETGEWLEGFDEQRAVWERSTPRRTPAGRRTSARSRSPRTPTRGPVRRRRTLRCRQPRLPRAPRKPTHRSRRRPPAPTPVAAWPPTRRCRHCARSSPGAERRSSRQVAPERLDLL
jgi:small subunit ribosomal protein S1